MAVSVFRLEPELVPEPVYTAALALFKAIMLETDWLGVQLIVKRDHADDKSFVTTLDVAVEVGGGE
jgi:hypothetical protein